MKVFLAASAALGLVHGAPAGSVIIGTADPGNGNEFPFGDGLGTDYEQVYNSANFSSSMSINQISFFNTQYQPGSSSWAPGTYYFYLSTTSVAVGGLVGNDEGPDNTLFGTYNLSGAVPSPMISFNGAAFNYNPSQGNLLLDIQTGPRVPGSGNVYLDAMNGDAGTLFSRLYNAGGGSQRFGLVTEFSSSVPDGGLTVALLGMAMGGLAWLRRKV
jgi:hypothetical protein